MIIITNSRVVGEADIAVEKDYDVVSQKTTEQPNAPLANDQI